jgi:hypothetical protein
MKKILPRPVSNTKIIFEDELPAHPIIGAHHTSNSQIGRSFLVMTNYRDPSSYIMMCSNGFEIGNGYGSDVKDNAKKASQYCGKLEDILKHPTLEFYLFDTPKELFAWLAK